MPTMAEQLRWSDLPIEFRQAGFIVTLCPPPHDQWGKDWSERWRRLGPQSIWPLYEALYTIQYIED